MITKSVYIASANRKKANILAFIRKKYRELKSVAIFDAEKKEAENYKKVIDYINSIDYNPRVTSCPMCGSSSIYTTTLRDISLIYRKLKTEKKTLKVAMCSICGWSAVGIIGKPELKRMEKENNVQDEE